eukprot:CAMPEP_0177604846 /NCGR_PEP_ID=MMETSP0419_2-20121207/16349_1 /TAXON_ID=582737 /ORGANISM="Tetraselmis sp., Strain GSL018" /LENGTH=637 /DNA_ID=CAMNT_0019098883 /DNA_START=331 /DNA_END=2244 /DNA_ORIENTATION=-
MWGPALQKRFNYSESQLSGLATACSVGSYLNIVPGIFYDKMKQHHRAGPKLILLAGVALQFCGFLGLWLAGAGRFSPPFWFVCAMGLLACNCGPWFETAAMVTSVRNFEADRGVVVSVCKACLGLSAAFYTTLYQATYSPDALGFLLLLALVPAASVLACTPFVNFVPVARGNSGPRAHGFLIAYAAIGSLIVYQLLNTLGAQQMPWNDHAWLRIASLVILLIPIAAIPFMYGRIIVKEIRRPDLRDGDEAQNEAGRPTMGSQASLDSLASPRPSSSVLHELSEAPESPCDDDPNKPLLRKIQSALEPFSRELRQRNRTPLECLVSTQFWLLFFIHFVASGTGFVLTSNLGTILRLLGATPDQSAVALSVYSTANAVGRACSGIAAEMLARRFKTPRAALFIPVAAVLLCVNLMMAGSSPATLLSAYAAGGFACGVSMGLAPAVTADCLGVKNMASNYAMVQAAPAISSYALAHKLFTFFYSGGVAGECQGAGCLAGTFAVLSGLSAVALMSACVLCLKTVRLYKKLQAKDSLMRQKEGLKMHNAVQEDLLLQINVHTAELETLFSRIQDAVQSAAGDLHRMKPELLGSRCASVLLDAASDAARGEQVIQQIRLRHSRYLGSGLGQLLQAASQPPQG